MDFVMLLKSPTYLAHQYKYEMMFVKFLKRIYIPILYAKHYFCFICFVNLKCHLWKKLYSTMGRDGFKKWKLFKTWACPTHIMCLGHFTKAGERERQLFFRNHKSSYSVLKPKFEPPEPGMNMMTYEFEK